MSWGRLPWLLAGAVFSGVALGLVFVLMFGLSGAVRYRDIPVVILPVPAVDGVGPTGSVPIASDPCARPCVAILVTELGHSEDVDRKVEALPGAFGLVFQPYAGGLAGAVDGARNLGHEPMVELPLQPASGSDAGSGTILIGEAATEGARQVERLLGGVEGLFGVAATAGAFADAPQQFAPLAVEIARRRLALIELGGTRLLPVASASGVPNAAAVGPIDGDPSPAAIDAALAGLEATARNRGAAIGFARPLPVTTERLSAWITSLDGKGLSLVPPSAVIAHVMGNR